MHLFITILKVLIIYTFLYTLMFCTYSWFSSPGTGCRLGLGQAPAATAVASKRKKGVAGGSSATGGGYMSVDDDTLPPIKVCIYFIFARILYITHAFEQLIHIYSMYIHTSFNMIQCVFYTCIYIVQ